MGLHSMLSKEGRKSKRKSWKKLQVQLQLPRDGIMNSLPFPLNSLVRWIVEGNQESSFLVSEFCSIGLIGVCVYIWSSRFQIFQPFPKVIFIWKGSVIVALVSWVRFWRFIVLCIGPSTSEGSDSLPVGPCRCPAFVPFLYEWKFNVKVKKKGPYSVLVW